MTGPTRTGRQETTERRDSSRKDWAQQVADRGDGSRLEAWDPRAERLVRAEERHLGRADDAPPAAARARSTPLPQEPDGQSPVRTPGPPAPPVPPSGGPGTPDLTPAPGAPKASGAVSLVQVAGSALAAVSAAVVSSSFGVAGTVIGAAVASIVATVGSAVYSASLRRTNDRLRRLASERRVPGAPTVVLPPGLRQDGRKQDGSAGTRSLRRGLAGLRRRWPAVLGAAVLVFVITIAVLTLVESATNKPVSSLVGGGSSGGTSVSRLIGGSPSSSRAPSPASSTPASAQPSTAPSSAAPGSAAPAPGPVPSSAAPTTAPTPVPSAVAPSAAPSAAVPSVAATP